MADRLAATSTTAYQSAAYRQLISGLKPAQDRRTILVTFAGAPRSAMRPAAEALASSLGRTVYQVDLSRVVSKWIGETEKNLRSLFNEVDPNRAILFFDEADSLFGKRSGVKSAHDRYGDQEMSHLTTVLAAFGGVIVAPLTHQPPRITTRARLRHVRVKFPPD
jgi:SpoVK/Ycf46/Vps4 family AAA+-type ATPase